MQNNDARLRELSNKIFEGTISDEEFAELAQLSAAKKKLREARASLIASVRETLQSQGIAMQELYSAQEIAAAAPQRDSIGRRLPIGRRSGALPMPAKPVKTPGSSATWVRQKTGLVLVEVVRPGGNGFPSRYCKGQALPRYVPKGFKLLDDGQLEANLARHYTAEGVQYFATDEGRAELARLINYIRTFQLKPGMR